MTEYRKLKDQLRKLKEKNKASKMRSVDKGSSKENHNKKVDEGKVHKKGIEKKRKKSK